MPINGDRPTSDGPHGVQHRVVTADDAPPELASRRSPDEVKNAPDATFDRCPSEIIICDASGLKPTLDTIDSLARLRLNARRRSRQIRLRNVDSELRELIAFVGLQDTLPTCDSTDHTQHR